MIDFNIYNGFDPQNKSVLIVDDNPQNLKVLEAMLNTIGISVRAARSGDECLKSIAKEKPDLILLDIHMPGIDGYEVCKTISLDKELSLIPVIFVSALSEEFNKEQAFKCGGVDYTTKPFDLKDVELRVKTHLILKEKTEKLKLAIENLANNEKIMIQSEKMAAIGILSAGIAHEINNPINFISNSFKVLTKDIEDIKTSKGKDKLDRLISDFDNINLSITAGIDYITNIVKGLRIYCGSEESEKVAVSVNNIIDSALTILYHRYKNHINIIKNYGNLNDILSYPAKLSQVFINLISNSIDSIDESCIKGEISIKTEYINENNSEVQIKISDNGKGIDESDIDRVFDPFFTTKEVDKGVGLGLYISKNMIHQMSGSIHIEKNRKSGACFTLVIPVS